MLTGSQKFGGSILSAEDQGVQRMQFGIVCHSVVSGTASCGAGVGRPYLFRLYHDANPVFPNRKQAVSPVRWRRYITDRNKSVKTF
jgi:hypothetical protein